MKHPFLILIPLTALLLAGCETVHHFSVDAINAPGRSPGRSYVVVPGDPETAVTDLRFQEAAEFAEAALAGHGFYRVQDAVDADMVVALDAAVGEPQTVTRNESRPMYVETGGYYRTVVRPVKTRDGRTTYVESVIWSPPYNRYVGSYDAQQSYLVYEKRFSLTAFENSGDPAEKLPQLWSVVVKNRDTSSDLRAYLPLLAAVAMDYIDENTAQQVIVSLKEDDPRVQVIREAVGRPTGSPTYRGNMDPTNSPP